MPLFMSAKVQGSGFLFYQWLQPPCEFCSSMLRKTAAVFFQCWPLQLGYSKNSKNWDTLNYYRDCPTNGIVGF